MSENKNLNQRPASRQNHPVTPTHTKKKKPVQKGKFKQDMTIYNIIIVAACLITNILLFVVMFNTTQFAGLSSGAFIALNVLVMFILLLLDLLVLLAVNTKKISYFSVASVLTVVLLLVGGYGTYAVTRMNKSISSMTSTTVQESVSTAFVVYADDGTQTITDIAQLDGRQVGYVASTNTATLGQEYLTTNSINATLVEYDSYSELLLGLFREEIEGAILPSNYLDMFENETAFAGFLPNTSSVMDFTSTVSVQSSSGSEKDITKEPFTVLLLGTADGLSDTMILCSVNPISMKITMSSIARDSYVPIHGGGMAKINSSRAYGIDTAVATVEDLIGVEIDYYVDTNFQGVVEVVDALGGVVVNSPIEFVGQNSSDERGHYTVYVPAGDNVLLNGEQALAFARERHLFATGDFARQEHQQQVIMAMIQGIMRTRNVNTLLNVLEAAGNNISTNMSVTQMTSFLSYALQKSNRIHTSVNVEDVFTIQSSRVTGYSSSLWDEGLQMALYTYRLWQGSIDDTRAAIERNTNLDSQPSAIKYAKWSINWDFDPPAISEEYYNEAQVQSDVPTTVSDFYGSNVGTVQSWANGFDIAVYITYVEDPTQANGTVIYQDIPAGTSIADVTAISVTVTQNTGGEVVVPADDSTPEGCYYYGGTWDTAGNYCAY